MSLLNIKIRVRVTKRMPGHTARALVMRALWDGIVPPGIEIAIVDWGKGGRGYRYRGGDRIDPNMLRKIAAIVSAPQAQQRWEIVARDQEGQG
ncbi:MAG: hypothetical protein K6T59_11585 [Bryobacteraceae bacterium]|nr:hypothetical protein [Bryobacteraceae bacterium]